MTASIPRREHFAGPAQLSPVWTMTKDGRTARCEIWSAEYGNELRLTIDGDDFPRTQVVRDEAGFARTVAEWMEELTATGWTAASDAP